jgi:hypothetical protein
MQHETRLQIILTKTPTSTNHLLVMAISMFQIGVLEGYAGWDNNPPLPHGERV